MTNLKHTPGPWSESAIFWLLRYADKSDGTWYEEIRSDNKNLPCGRDDALLIAAAPEMLEALIMIYKVWHEDSILISSVKAIIEKATGLKIEEIL